MKGDLLKLSQISSPTCERCHDKNEKVLYILYDCEVLAELISSSKVK
jgi:hypothetical protein